MQFKLTGFLPFLLTILVIGSAYSQSVVITNNNLDSLFSVCEQSLQQQPRIALALGAKLLAFSQEKNNIPSVARCNYITGRAHRNLGASDKTIAALQQSIALCRTVEEYELLCLSLKELGITYYLRNETGKALTLYTEALAIAKDKNLTTEVAAIYNNIGNLYDTRKNYDQAITYYHEGLALQPDDKKRSTLLYNLGRAHAGKGDFETAMMHYQQSAAIAQKMDDPAAGITALNGIASIYWMQEKDQEVLNVSFTILELQQNTGMATDRIETYNRIGLAYLNMNQPVKAITHFREALMLAETVKYSNIHFIYANLAFAYERAGNYKQAYAYFVKHKQLQDSVENIESKRNLDEMLARYEADKKEQQIAQLTLEKKMQALTLQKKMAELDRETLIRNSIIGGALLIFICILVLQLFYRQRMRSKIQLAAQTEEVNRQRTLELIREHELKTIKANLEGRENERLRISQELHDGVAGSLAGIKLQTRKVADEHNLKELHLIMQNIDSVYDEVRSLSHNLSPLKVLNTAFIDLLRNQLKLAGEQGSFASDFICYPEVTLNQLPDTIKIEVYRILQELLANIIRHAHTTTVEIQFTLNDESINLMVEDSGKGFDLNRVAPGVGLSSIRNRVSSLEGKLHIESTIGRGTIINIDIPLQYISQSSRI